MEGIPSIGRIVIYQDPAGYEAPAIIVKVVDFPTGTCEIHPFDPNNSIVVRIGKGNVVAKYDQRGEAGTWRWPSRL